MRVVVAKRKSVFDAKQYLAPIMRECCKSGKHGPFYEALKAYGVEPGSVEWTNAVAALLEKCRQLRSGQE